MKKDKKMIVCFLTPALFMFSVIFLYPVLRTIAMSFFQVEGVSDAFSTWKFTGLDNYITLLQTPIFLDSMKNMLKIWVYGGIAVMLVSLLFAAILTNGLAGKTFYKTVIYIPNIINAVAMATMWNTAIFNKRFGFLHNFFAFFGSDLAKTDYMSGSIKFWSLLVAFCFGSVGYYMLIFMGGIERLSPDMYEAAELDGLGAWGILFRVAVPLSKSSIGVTGLMAFLFSWNEFMFALSLTSTSAAQTLPIGIAGYVTSFRTFWGSMSATGILFMIPAFILTFIFQKDLVKGLTAGAVKG